MKTIDYKTLVEDCLKPLFIIFKVEAAHLPINRRMDKQNVVHAHEAKLFSN